MRRAVRRLFITGGLFLLAVLCTALLAAEYLRVHGATIIVTNTNDSGTGSLRQAIADASDGNTIQFSPVLNGQIIHLTSAELAIDKNITIDGPGPSLLTVSRDSDAGKFRIVHVMPGHIAMIQDLTISGGWGDGAGVLNEDSMLTIENCAIRNNFAPPPGSGGGIASGGKGGGATLILLTRPSSRDSAPT